MPNLNNLSDEELIRLANSKGIKTDFNKMSDEELLAEAKKAGIGNSKKPDKIASLAMVAKGGAPLDQLSPETQESSKQFAAGAMGFAKGFSKPIPFSDYSLLPKQFLSEAEMGAKEFPGTAGISEFAGDIMNPSTTAGLKLAGKAAKTAKPLLEGTIEKGQKILKPLLDKHATNVIAGFNKSTLKIADQILPGKHIMKQKVKDLGEFASSNGLLKNTSEETAMAASELRDQIGKKMSEISGKGNYLSVNFNAEKDVYKPLEAKLKEALGKNPVASQRQKIQDVLDEFAELKDSKKYMSIDDLLEMRRNFDDTINWKAIKAGTAGPKDIAKADFRHTVQDIINGKIDDILGAKDKTEFQALNREWQKALAIEKMAEKGEAAENILSIPSLKQLALPGARTNRFLQNQKLPQMGSNLGKTLTKEPTRLGIAASYGEPQQ